MRHDEPNLTRDVFASSKRRIENNRSNKSIVLPNQTIKLTQHAYFSSSRIRGREGTTGVLCHLRKAIDGAKGFDASTDTNFERVCT
jgi:hypothetical protein